MWIVIGKYVDFIIIFSQQWEFKNLRTNML